MKSSSLRNPFIRKGQKITADGLNQLALAATRHTLLPGSFQNAQMSLQAPQPAPKKLPTPYTPAWGQLIKTIPADTLLEEPAVRLEQWGEDGEIGFTWIYEDPDADPLQIKTIYAYNTSLNSAIRGSALTGDSWEPAADDIDDEGPIRVYGYIVTAEFVEGTETVDREVFIIQGFMDPLAGAAGFKRDPDNNVGQALMHRDGQLNTIADGGPCGVDPES